MVSQKVILIKLLTALVLLIVFIGMLIVFVNKGIIKNDIDEYKEIISDENENEDEKIVANIIENTIVDNFDNTIVENTITTNDGVVYHGYENIVDFHELKDKELITQAYYEEASGKVINDKNLKEKIEKAYNEFDKFSIYMTGPIGPTPHVFVTLGMVDSSETLYDYIDSLKVYDSSTYIKSSIKYSDFKEKMTEHMTEDCFDKYFKHYLDIDGYVGYCNCGGDGPNTALDKCEEIKEIGDKTYLAKLRINDIGEANDTGEPIDVYTRFYKFKDVNGKIVMDDLYMDE